MQRTVLYLGKINDQQQAAWRKPLSVFDEQQQEYANLSLFPDDREIPADAIDSLQVKLSGLELRRPRLFGSCWLACELWRQLGLHEFWDARLVGSREHVPWENVLQLLVVNRLLDPGSEFRVHHQWYLTTATDALLGSQRAVDPPPAVDTDRIGLPIKSELGIRRIYHQLEHRADAHILIAFLAYCLQITLKHRLLLHAPRLRPRAVLGKLAEIKMIDVWIPTVEKRWLILPATHNLPQTANCS